MMAIRSALRFLTVSTACWMAAVPTSAHSQTASARIAGGLSATIHGIDGLDAVEATRLARMVVGAFRSAGVDTTLPAAHVRTLSNVIQVGIFENVDFDRIARVAVLCARAQAQGAAGDYLEELAPIAFSKDVSGEAFTVAAIQLERAQSADMPTEVVEEMIRYALDNGWPAQTLSASVEGLVAGAAQGLDPQQVGLSIVVGIDQAAGRRPVEQVISESVALVGRPARQSDVQKAASTGIQRANGVGFPRDLSLEVYHHALESRWTAEITRVIFDGLVSGFQDGLSPQYLVRELVIRMDQGIGKTSPSKAVAQGLAEVRKLEGARYNLAQRDKQRIPRKPKKVPQAYRGAVQRPRPAPPKKRQLPGIQVPQVQRGQLNYALMQASMKSFLGPPSTPYRWGGKSRRGADCSGFTWTVYYEQGIVLPRVSWQQARTGVAVSPQSMRFGDLVFFTKYTGGPVNHVGIYLGNGKFVHSSSSKGVNISSLNSRYYRVRFAGARRIVG